MTKFLAVWILVVALLTSGCSTLASKEATVVCQTADTITTVVALNNGAVEANPVMAAVIDSAGIGGLILVKLLAIWFLLEWHEEIPDEAHVVMNAATCGVAAHNLTVF